MKQLQMMPTLVRTFAKRLWTALGSRTTLWTALVCYWRTVNTLTLSVTLVSVVGKTAMVNMFAHICKYKCDNQCDDYTVYICL